MHTQIVDASVHETSLIYIDAPKQAWRQQAVVVKS